MTLDMSDTVMSAMVSAADALPHDPLIAGGCAAAAGAVVIGGLWRRADPLRRLGTRPVLTTGRRTRRMDEVLSHALEIPLDVVPRDGTGRTPWDVVGVDGVRAAVDQFYSKVCADPELEHFFTSVDVPQLRRHQAALIGQLWGGPSVYELSALADAHQSLQISPPQYWKVVGHLMVTLTHMSVPDWICSFTMTRLYQARNLIINQNLLPAGQTVAECVETGGAATDTAVQP